MAKNRAIDKVTTDNLGIDKVKSSQSETVYTEQPAAEFSIQQKGGERLVVAPIQKESRNKRMQILVKPSVHKKLEKRCKELNVSINEAVNQLIEQWVNEE